jgi:hypothetical protein
MARPRQPPETCPVLDLVLGPIDLNLLGLHLRVDCQDDQIHVLVEGIPGALLGDILCALSTPEVQAALAQQIQTSPQVGSATRSEPAQG